MIKKYNPDCPLCRLVFDSEILTRLVYEDEKIIVTDCIVCHIPMAVLKLHRSRFLDNEKDHVRKYFRKLIMENQVPLAENTDLLSIYGGDVLIANPKKTPWVIDWEQRQIPDHAHCHLRPRSFPKTEYWESLFRR